MSQTITHKNFTFPVYCQSEEYPDFLLPVIYKNYCFFPLLKRQSFQIATSSTSWAVELNRGKPSFLPVGQP